MGVGAKIGGAFAALDMLNTGFPLSFLYVCHYFFTSVVARLCAFLERYIDISAVCKTNFPVED